MRGWLLVGALLGTALSHPACTYFNTLYNAERLFAEAERAASQGDRTRARSIYQVAIEKAAKGLRKDPDGRWADDALYLIARAHYGRDDFPAARAALERLLATTTDREIRVGALTLLGATMLRLGEGPQAMVYLDSALHSVDAGSEQAALARLWRGRVRFAAGDETEAWADIEAAAARKGPIGREARLELATQAVLRGDQERARAAFAALFRDRDAHQWADSLRTLAERAHARWGARSARALLEPAAAAAWPAEPRDGLSLFRAELAARGGDTAQAVAEARLVADRASGVTADRARVLLARWRLAYAADIEELAEVRAILLPSLAHPEARAILQSMQLLHALLDAGQRTGQPLAFFAAAEVARDELGSRALARQLFLAYADLVPGATWAPKALLAAAALQPAPEEHAAIRDRLAGYTGNVYLAALQGGHDSLPFSEAEERLARTLAALRSEAARYAAQRDAFVTLTLATLDSVKAAAKADSVKVACGALLDSLGVTGIRGDSLRAACIRGDSLRFEFFLRADTASLRDAATTQNDTASVTGTRRSDADSGGAKQ